MAPKVVTGPVTADELLMLPDDGVRHELRRGELTTVVPPGYRHGRVVAAIAAKLERHVAAQGLGHVLAGDPGFKLSSDPDTVRGPDVAFVAQARVDAVGVPDGFWPGPPDVAIEVVSPGDSYSDLQEKALEWLTADTRLVLVVDPRRRTVTAYRSPDRIVELSTGQLLDASDGVPGWSIPVEELFGDGGQRRPGEAGPPAQGAARRR
jgi:Uma2 family endonuclease